MPFTCPCNGAHGLDEWFQYQATHNPSATAVVQNDQSVTYRELSDHANRIAADLSSWNLRREEPVCILVPMGIQHIAAQMATIRLAGSCVPLDPAFPDERIQALLKAVGTRLVITTEAIKPRLSNFQTMVIPELYEPSTEALPVNPSIHTGGNHRTHVLHTSGTTGLPKPVEILSRGITRMAFNKSVVEFKSTDRVAAVAAPSFDASLFEIWTTLARGATVIVLSKNMVIDPFTLAENIAKFKINTILLTTAFLNHVVSALPSAFENLDYVLTGGEAANAEVLKAILEGGAPKQLINAYGPTEGSCIVSYHQITMKDIENGTTPIGVALDNTSCYLLNQETLKPVTGEEIGELYVAGDAVARGYYCRPDANRKSFFDLPGLDAADPQKVTRVYKTGDLCKFVEGGVMQYIARADNQIKMRGLRIEPAELEGILLASGYVTGAVVVPVKRPGKETYIQAFVIVKEGCEDALSSGEIKAFMKSKLPENIIPRLEAVSEIPFTVHGKVDRKAMIESHIKAHEEHEKKAAEASETATDSISWLKNLWMSILDVTKVENDSDFFQIGGSSLQAAAVIVHVRRRFGKLLQVQDIYNNPTLTGLLSLVEAEQSSMQVDHSIVPGLLADTKLANHIPIPQGETIDWRAEGEGKVFMTGATGFLGAYMVRTLIDKDYVNKVTCLVRAANEEAGRVRLIEALNKYGLGKSNNLHKIGAVAGNLDQKRWGLSDATFTQLAETQSIVYHIGAHVNYVQGYDKHRAANVEGTLTAIELAAAGRKKALHYTSTGAVSGPAYHFSGTELILENEPLSTYVPFLAYDIGYTQSKWVSEGLINSAIEHGLSAVIYRPGFIMGDKKTGKGNPDDFMGRVFMGSIKLGKRPILPNQTKSLVPADYVVNALIHIASDSKNWGNTFHLTPQTREVDPDLEVLWAWLEQLGYPLQPVLYRDWLDALSQDPNLLKNPLLAMLPVLQEPADNGITRWELFENMATYDTSNTVKALADHEPMNSGFDFIDMERLVQSWKDRGLMAA